METMRCVRCGLNDAVHRNLCTRCLAENLRITAPGRIEYHVCRKCGSVKTGKRWIRDEPVRAVEDFILHGISSGDPDVDLTLSAIEKTGENFNVSINASINGTKLRDFNITLPYTERNESCTLCDKKSGSYYEAIIQVRFEDTGNMEPYSSIPHDLSAVRYTDPEDFISKIVRSPSGFDIYTGTRKMGEKMIRILSENYAGYRKVSKKLAGKEEGHDLYRYTYLYRIFNYRLGTIMAIDNKTCCLVKITPGGVTVEMENGVRENLSMQDLQRRGLRIVESRPEIRRYQILSREKDVATVMDMETFLTHDVSYGSEGSEIIVSRWRNRDFVIG